MYQLKLNRRSSPAGERLPPYMVRCQTPAFMNVATAAAIKGGISAYDLKELKCQVMLCNTYHLHLRPGDNVVRQLGGLHRFTGWQGPHPDRQWLGSRCFRLHRYGISRKRE